MARWARRSGSTTPGRLDRPVLIVLDREAIGAPPANLVVEPVQIQDPGGPSLLEPREGPQTLLPATAEPRRLFGMSQDVKTAYSRAAGEYAARLGAMSAVHPADVQLVTEWADRLEGPVIDAGCGPGHWTGHLATRGVDARGIDQVPEFVDHALRANPDVSFSIGNIENLQVPTGGVAGVLAWYSLIHYEIDALRVPLAEFARILRPGGGLLLGFFHGSVVEQFDHAILRAYQWPIDALCNELSASGFDVIETYTRTGPGYRPHGAISAHLRPVY